MIVRLEALKAMVMLQGFFGRAKSTPWSLGTQTARQFSPGLIGSHRCACSALSVKTLCPIFFASVCGVSAGFL